MRSIVISKIAQKSELGLDSFNISQSRLYTDSKTILAWLHLPPHTLNIFVANRVLQILDLTLVNNWSYVKSEFNPADCASRDLRPLEFLRHDCWFIGPSFIRTPEQHVDAVLWSNYY